MEQTGLLLSIGIFYAPQFAAFPALCVLSGVSPHPTGDAVNGSLEIRVTGADKKRRAGTSLCADNISTLSLSGCGKIRVSRRRPPTAISQPSFAL
jgi:hypothetical protein